jgi:hypothetical protein
MPGPNRAATGDRLAVGGEDQEARRRDRLQRLGERSGDREPADEEDEQREQAAQHIFRADADDPAGAVLALSTSLEDLTDQRGLVSLDVAETDRHGAGAVERPIQIIGPDRRLDILPERGLVAVDAPHVALELCGGEGSHLGALVKRLLDARALLAGEIAPGLVRNG